jgi:DNA-directed RNA polymerase specialized sigma24 family protein
VKDISNSEISAIIDEYVRGERDRRIMKLRLIDCLTYEKIAEKVDMSVRQIKNIVYKHEMTVYRHLQQ